MNGVRIDCQRDQAEGGAESIENATLDRFGCRYAAYSDFRMAADDSDQ